MDNLMVDRDNSRYREIVRAVSENVSGERAHLDLHVDLKPILADGAKIPGSFGWDTFVETLKALHPTWYAPVMAGKIRRAGAITGTDDFQLIGAPCGMSSFSISARLRPVSRKANDFSAKLTAKSICAAFSRDFAASWFACACATSAASLSRQMGSVIPACGQ